MKVEKKEVKETIETETPKQESSIDKNFADFEKTIATHEVESNIQNSDTNISKVNVSKPSDPFNASISDMVKIKMFLGFACFLLSGLNMFLFNILSKTKVELSDMTLDADEKESIEPYLNDPRIVEMINKLPSWVIAVAHIEIIMYDKFTDGVKRIKAEEKKKEEEKQ